MKGLEEAKKFYEECGADMLSREFPDYVGRIAVGLVGHGSECFGFDDEISRDHDFETGFSMWLTREDEAKIGFKLMRAYDRIKTEYCGTKLKHMSVIGSNSQGVQIIGDFYRKYTGCEGAPATLRDWLFTESAYFAEATNGEVWRDDIGVFSKIREKIANGMPEDVRLKKLAAAAVRMAQTGQYNYPRCIDHGEEGAAMLALSEFVRGAIEMIFLLNKKHCPYYKWSFRMLKTLPKLSDMAEPLEFLLTADNENKKVKRDIIEDIALAITNEIKSQGLADCKESYLEPYGFAMLKKIKSAELRNMHILVG
ncbi:MAG: DUF4037 domain-containing protein [Clostridia bacterium]|nr:DUF4037 domain-containing protein [Clostridia bacterium]